MPKCGRHISICLCRSRRNRKASKVSATGSLSNSARNQDHARILMNYLLARGGQVLLAPIAEVRTSWGSQLEAFEDTLAHEKKVTAMINNLYDMAVTEKDHATASMLKWFIDEQVEEEESATTIIDSLKLVSGDKMGVFMLDKELATRTYTQAAPLAGKE